MVNFRGYFPQDRGGVIARTEKMVILDQFGQDLFTMVFAENLVGLGFL